MKRVIVVIVGFCVASVVVYAAASYPSSVKSFTTKTSGQTIASSHINEIQDEIVAVEGALLNGFAHALKPSSSGAQNLGTSSLVWGTVYANQIIGTALNLQQCNLRLTLETGVPVSTSDQTAKTSVFVTPVDGGQCAFYDGSALWTMLINSEATVTVPSTTTTPFDIFCRNNSGTIACDATSWTNDTTRATALTKQNGVYVKTGDTTRRYVGTGRTTGVSGQTEDSLAKRYVYSYYHQADRTIRVAEATNTWTYALNAWQQANNSAANQVDVMIGLADGRSLLRLRVDAAAGSSGNTGSMPVGIGEDGITGPVSGCVMQTYTNAGSSATAVPVAAALEKYPSVGRHYYTWIEKSPATITVTYYGDNGVDYFQSAIHGWIRM